MRLLSSSPDWEVERTRESRATPLSSPPLSSRHPRGAGLGRPMQSTTPPRPKRLAALGIGQLQRREPRIGRRFQASVPEFQHSARTNTTIPTPKRIQHKDIKQQIEQHTAVTLTRVAHENDHQYQQRIHAYTWCEDLTKSDLTDMNQQTWRREPRKEIDQNKIRHHSDGHLWSSQPNIKLEKIQESGSQSAFKQKKMQKRSLPDYKQKKSQNRSQPISKPKKIRKNSTSEANKSSSTQKSSLKTNQTSGVQSFLIQTPCACAGCTRTPCGQCPICISNLKSRKKSTPRCLLRNCLGASNYDEQQLQAMSSSKLGSLKEFVEVCGGRASSLNEWWVVSRPRPAEIRNGYLRVDTFYYAPCGRKYRSAVDVLRSLGLHPGENRFSSFEKLGKAMGEEIQDR